MTFDPTPPHTHHKTQTFSPALNALKDALADTLSTDKPQDEQSVMSRQASILDQIFTILMAERVAPILTDPRKQQTVQDWLAYALRVQRQCHETLRTKASMAYMESLQKGPPAKQIPPPPILQERNE